MSLIKSQGACDPYSPMTPHSSALLRLKLSGTLPGFTKYLAMKPMPSWVAAYEGELCPAHLLDPEDPSRFLEKAPLVAVKCAMALILGQRVSDPKLGGVTITSPVSFEAAFDSLVTTMNSKASQFFEKRDMSNNNHSRLSHLLSRLLRHSDIAMDSQGWVYLSVLMSHKEIRSKFSLDDIRQVVATNEKKRFAIDEVGARIRAVQGHTREGVVAAEVIKRDDPVLKGRVIHGTTFAALPLIKQSGGLSRMKR
jgi:hypothetical protein